ncbi:Spermatogenesis-defective protein 39 [Amphibalanus amphitrite]|uniref:Spermatogenesis-defective protein 39 n=1 Tax=Amphibalanus amphitrite TaxID=1232801 RepID=A0A6A4WLY3_AMPAM|nr:Spermatogenesis-defective protein 39 [Amphibalanus amphitrite]
MMTSKNKKRDLFMGDEYWNESSRKVTPFDFDDDTDTDTFMTMLAAEVAFLRRRLAEAREVAPPPADTARRLALGEPCTLELYRPLAEKRQLLAETVALGDGDAVLVVVLFLKRTLKRSLFVAELRRQPVACEQYLAYLRARFSHADAADLLAMLGRVEEAAMVRYESAVRVRGGVEPQLRGLRHCLQAHLAPDPELALHTGLVRQQIDLLERQRPVEAADAPARPDLQLVGRSVLSTLHYCCLHHYSEPANHLASPAALRERHQLTERQYTWTALRARASLQAWADVQALFTSKAWFSSGKLRPVVPFEAAAEVLESFGATLETLSLYIASIDGTEKRLEHAKKFGCYKIVVDGYLSQKDRVSLEQYRATLKPHSEAHQYASDALRATVIPIC